MYKLTFKSKVPQILSEIVNFVVDNVDSSEFELMKRKFIKYKLKEINNTKGEKEKIVDILNEYSFYTLSLYNKENITDADIFKLIMIFSHIKGELLERLTSYSEDKMYEEYGKLERQVSPPLSAYVYTGNNKIDITYSNKSYGLLFE